jgi:hypothetical protein
MTLQAPPSSPCAPANTNPIRLAAVTIEAVDQIGCAASGEIERAADDLIHGANEVADNLRKLATAIREHSKVAGVRVSDFCTKATEMMEGVRELQVTLAADHSKGNVEADGNKLPEMVRRDAGRQR